MLTTRHMRLAARPAWDGTSYCKIVRGGVIGDKPDLKARRPGRAHVLNPTVGNTADTRVPARTIWPAPLAHLNRIISLRPLIHLGRRRRRKRATWRKYDQRAGSKYSISMFHAQNPRSMTLTRQWHQGMSSPRRSCSEVMSAAETQLSD